MRRSWCSVRGSRCCGVRSPGPNRTGVTGRSWRARPMLSAVPSSTCRTSCHGRSADAPDGGGGQRAGRLTASRMAATIRPVLRRSGHGRTQPAAQARAWPDLGMAIVPAVPSRRAAASSRRPMAAGLPVVSVTRQTAATFGAMDPAGNGRARSCAGARGWRCSVPGPAGTRSFPGSARRVRRRGTGGTVPGRPRFPSPARRLGGGCRG